MGGRKTRTRGGKKRKGGSRVGQMGERERGVRNVGGKGKERKDRNVGKGEGEKKEKEEKEGKKKKQGKKSTNNSVKN